MTQRGLPDVQVALRALVGKWGNYAGTEKAGAQSFLNDLIAARAHGGQR